MGPLEGIGWKPWALLRGCSCTRNAPYLKATLTAIANGHPQSRLDELLPWNFTPSK